MFVSRLFAIGVATLIAGLVSAQSFTNSTSLPVQPGFTCSPSCINNGGNDTSSTSKFIVCGTILQASTNTRLACYWVVSSNSSQILSISGPTLLPHVTPTTAPLASYATFVNDNGDICGFGYLDTDYPSGGGAMATRLRRIGSKPRMTWPNSQPIQTALVWHNLGTTTAPNYSNPYRINIATNGAVQCSWAINNNYVCGGSYNSTPGWYYKLSDLWNQTTMTYLAPTIAPIDNCAAIDPVYNHMGGNTQVLLFNPNANPPAFNSTSVQTQLISWGGQNWQLWVNRLRGNASGSTIDIAGGINPGMARYLAWFGTLKAVGTVDTTPVLSGNGTIKTTQNTPTGLNKQFTMVGYVPLIGGVDDYWAWYDVHGGSTVSKLDLEAFYGVNDDDAAGSYRPSAPFVVGLDPNGNGAIFWSS